MDCCQCLHQSTLWTFLIQVKEFIELSVPFFGMNSSIPLHYIFPPGKYKERDSQNVCVYITFNCTVKTSNDNIAGNDRVLKAYMFTVWLYLFKNILKKLVTYTHLFY